MPSPIPRGPFRGLCSPARPAIPSRIPPRPGRLLRQGAIPFVLALTLLLGLSPCPSQAEPTAIHNGTTPRDGVQRIALEQLWRVGASEEDPLLGVIGRVLRDEQGRFLLLDRQLHEIHVLDATGQLVDTLGREGEGPGEFRNAADLFWMGDGTLGVLQMMPSRLVRLGLDGTALDDYRLPLGEGFNFLARARPLGDGLIVASTTSSFTDDVMKQHSTVAWAPAGAESPTIEFAAADAEVDFARLRFREVDLDSFLRYWDITADGHVVVAPDFDTYRLLYYTPDGQLVRTVEREYTPHRRDDDALERAKDQFRININGREAEIEVAPDERVIQALYPRSDGNLWILTDEGQHDLPEGVFVRFDVLDAEGRFIRQLEFEGEGNLLEDGLSVCDDAIVVVRGLREAARGADGDAEEKDMAEDEDLEPLEVIAYSLPTQR